MKQIVRCKFDEMLGIKDLLLAQNPKNPNKHPADQIKLIAEILAYQGIRQPIVISNLSKKMTRGHGRLQAAIKNQWDEYPVEYQDYESEELEYADMVADNAIASWASLDYAAINIEVPELGPDFNISMLGIKDFQIEPADKPKKPRLCSKCQAEIS